MTIRGLARTTTTRIPRFGDIEDARRKRLVLTPEYILSIMRRKEGSHELLPAASSPSTAKTCSLQQDLYDQEGTLVTRSTTPNIRDTTSAPTHQNRNQPPTRKLSTHPDCRKSQPEHDLSDDVFKLTIPADTQIQNLEDNTD